MATAGNSFAVWITRNHGRLRVGDLAYIRSGQPPRLGDTVAVLAAKRIVDMGDLQEADGDYLVGGRRYDRSSHRVLKIVGIVCG